MGLLDKAPTLPLKTWPRATPSSPSSTIRAPDDDWSESPEGSWNKRQLLRTIQVVDVIVRFPVTGIELRGNELRVFYPSYAGTVAR